MKEPDRFEMAAGATISELNYLGVQAWPLRTKEAADEIHALEYHMGIARREDDFNAFMGMLDMWEKLFKENQV